MAPLRNFFWGVYIYKVISIELCILVGSYHHRSFVGTVATTYEIIMYLTIYLNFPFCPIFLPFFSIFVDDALLGLKSTNYDVKMFFNSRLFDLYTSFPSH